MDIRVKRLLFALGVFAATLVASGGEAVFRGGLWKEFVYDKPSMAPVVFSGLSRSVDARVSDYCIYLDIWYDDGTTVWGRRAEWTQGTHGWERTTGAFVPEKPVKKIQMFALLRRGSGHAEFKDLSLERREGKGDVLDAVYMTGAPYEPVEQLQLRIFVGRSIVSKVVDVPLTERLAHNPLLPDEVVVWPCDSMRRVTPLTFPGSEDRARRRVSIELARRERESFQIQVTAGERAEWRKGGVVMPVLRNARGEALRVRSRGSALDMSRASRDTSPILTALLGWRSGCRIRFCRPRRTACAQVPRRVCG